VNISGGRIKIKVQGWIKSIIHLISHKPCTVEQLIYTLRDAQTLGIINNETLGMLEGVISCAQLKVRDIMLPKNQLLTVAHDTEFTEIIQLVTRSGHSRFPVTGDNHDEIIGILHAKDLLRFSAHPEMNFDLSDIIRQATFVPESKRLDLLLSEFRNNRNHMAIVVDEYGATAGFVTLENIIEQIIGDIEDEFDIDEESYIKSHDDTNYIIKAHTPIAEFNQQLHANFSDDIYDTVGGIVMAKFAYLPKRGEHINIEGFEFTIITSDARRIKLLACHDKRTLPTEKNTS